jgi:hypothetical protein
MRRIRISLRSAILMFTIAAVILEASAARAQPVYRTYQSLEARAAQAKSIYRGTVSECVGVFVERPGGGFGGNREDGSRRPDGVMRYTIRVKVDDVLKGKPSPALELIQETSAGDDRFKQWSDAHTLFLWFIGCDQSSNLGQSPFFVGESGFSTEKPTPWHTIRLGKAVPAEKGYTEDSPVYLMDFTHLTEPQEILDNVRSLAKSPAKKTVQFHEFPTIPNGSPFHRLKVPVQPSLERVARRLITTPEEFVQGKDGRDMNPVLRRMLRAEGVDALRYFKSAQNARLLKSLLCDSDSYLVTDDESNVTHREYPIRSKACEVLKTWGECVCDP